MRRSGSETETIATAGRDLHLTYPLNCHNWLPLSSLYDGPHTLAPFTLLIFFGFLFGILHLSDCQCCCFSTRCPCAVCFIRHLMVPYGKISLSISCDPFLGL